MGPKAGRCDRAAEQGATRGSRPEHLEAWGPMSSTPLRTKPPFTDE
jgi:hypothetical protein